MKAKAGVTLLELLVVIAIMAIIAGIAMPAFQSIGRGSGMRGMVAQTTSTCNLSRQWAITKRAPISITFSVDREMLLGELYASNGQIYTNKPPNIVYKKPPAPLIALKGDRTYKEIVTSNQYLVVVSLDELQVITSEEWDGVLYPPKMEKYFGGAWSTADLFTYKTDGGLVQEQDHRIVIHDVQTALEKNVVVNGLTGTTSVN